MKINKKQKGFTLIELIVVIAIIGILATIGTLALLGWRKNARDTQRISNGKIIKQALELYNVEKGVYPYGAGITKWAELEAELASSISGGKLPVDLKTTDNDYKFEYGWETGGAGYVVRVRLEDSGNLPTDAASKEVPIAGGVNDADAPGEPSSPVSCGGEYYCLEE